MVVARVCISSRTARIAKKPLVSTNVSRTIDDFVDLAIAEPGLPTIRKRPQPIERIVIADTIRGPDRFESNHGPPSVGEHETLAAPHLFDDLLGTLPQIEHRDRTGLAHE